MTKTTSRKRRRLPKKPKKPRNLHKKTCPDSFLWFGLVNLHDERQSRTSLYSFLRGKRTGQHTLGCYELYIIPLFLQASRKKKTLPGIPTFLSRLHITTMLRGQMGIFFRAQDATHSYSLYIFLGKHGLIFLVFVCVDVA